MDLRTSFSGHASQRLSPAENSDKYHHDGYLQQTMNEAPMVYDKTSPTSHKITSAIAIVHIWLICLGPDYPRLMHP
jgi:hypothetical protein